MLKLFILLLKWQSDRSRLNISLGLERTVRKNRFNKTRKKRESRAELHLVECWDETFNNCTNPLGQAVKGLHTRMVGASGGSAGSTGSWAVVD